MRRDCVGFFTDERQREMARSYHPQLTIAQMSLECANTVRPLADVHYRDKGASGTLAAAILGEYRLKATDDFVPVFLMVGATTSTGDVMGPFVGWHLQRKGFRGWHTGSLGDPVHGTNMKERVAEIKARVLRTGKYPFIIAVDAAIGRPGSITVNLGPLKPGSGLNKPMPPAGDMHIMGGTATDDYMLWFAPMELTVTIAEVIADAIMEFDRKWREGVAA